MVQNTFNLDANDNLMSWLQIFDPDNNSELISAQSIIRIYEVSGDYVGFLKSERINFDDGSFSKKALFYDRLDGKQFEYILYTDEVLRDENGNAILDADGNEQPIFDYSSIVYITGSLGGEDFLRREVYTKNDTTDQPWDKIIDVFINGNLASETFLYDVGEKQLRLIDHDGTKSWTSLSRYEKLVDESDPDSALYISTELYIWDDGARLSIEYNANGTIKSRQRVDAEGRFDYRTTYEYDSSGNLIRENVEDFDQEDAAVWDTAITIKDCNGNIIQQLDQNGNLVNHLLTYDYTHDGGSPTVEDIVFENGVIEQTLETVAGGNIVRTLADNEDIRAWESQEFTYSASGHLASIKTTYDAEHPQYPGGTVHDFYDYNGSNAEWSHTRKIFDSSGALWKEFVYFDDGSHTFRENDLGVGEDQREFSYYLDYYDSNGNLTSEIKQFRDIDGTWQDYKVNANHDSTEVLLYDGPSTEHTWTSQLVKYKPVGEESSIVSNFITWFDGSQSFVENLPGDQVKVTEYNEYQQVVSVETTDSNGVVLIQQLFDVENENLDWGNYSNLFAHAKSEDALTSILDLSSGDSNHDWLYFIDAMDNSGNQDYTEVTFDNGWQLLIDYDQGDSEDWAQEWRLRDANGDLYKSLQILDNGEIANEYDHFI